MEKSPWTAKKKPKQGPNKKTKAEFAESKKKNLADSNKESVEQGIRQTRCNFIFCTLPPHIFQYFVFMGQGFKQQS